MVTKRNSRKSRTIGPAVLGKPNGVIQPRVQAVGPERFGIVAVDCAKARSKWMLCDFYGKVLLPPTVVEHQRAALEMATLQLREARVEQGLVEILVKTPYILLLSHPGIGVVSAADLAGEMGPIEYYAHAKAITGRAGLFPSRYQSDEVDRADGPLARHRNARLRAVWLRVADNLIKCNAHFRGKFQLWKQRGVDARDNRCRVANRATRTIFQMVSGRRLYHHPSRLDRGYVLDKLLTFHREHDTPPHEILRDMRQAVEQIPQWEQATETVPLQRVYQRAHRSRRPGVQAIGEILVVVLARLGVGGLQWETETPSPEANVSETST